jgi:hypothetical protein
VADATHYLCAVRIDRVLHYVVWYTNDRDGLVRREDQSVVLSNTVEEARSEAARTGLTIAADLPVLYDFDQLPDVLAREPREEPECRVLLDAWNFLGDAVESSDDGGRFDSISDEASDIYEKLFWASNLPSMTPPGERFLPTWHAKETDTIRHVLEIGVEGLRSVLMIARRGRTRG